MKKESARRWYALSLVFQLGISLSLPLLVGIAGGVWLDKKFATTPLFTLLGLFLGLGISAYSFYIDLLPLLKNKRK